MTVETMNPVAGTTADGARKALLCGELFDPITTATVEHPAVARQRLKAKLERVIDRLLVALDRIDGDADLEPGGDDEPSLGAPLPYPVVSQEQWADGDHGDRETVAADLEPSLGASEFVMDQTRWANGGHADLEGDHDGREPEDGQ